MLRGAGKSVKGRTCQYWQLFTNPAPKSSPDEPQEPQASTLRCPALLCLPQQTVSSVQAGRAGLWPVPTLSQGPVPCLPCSCAHDSLSKQRSPPAGSKPKTRLGRGQWPFRALPGCPLGGGRVLILQAQGSLLALLKTQGRGLGWHSGSLGQRRERVEMGLSASPGARSPSVPHPAAQGSHPCKKKATPPSVHSGASRPRGLQQPDRLAESAERPPWPARAQFT